MTKPFTGFSTDRQRTVRVPEGFFEDVLSQITSMLEMKVTLYMFWRLSKSAREGAAPRMVSMADLEADTGLRAVLARSKGPRPVEDALREGLELAVARGTVLQIWVREEPTDISEGRAEQWYVLNTRDNRAWVEALGQGQVDVTRTPLLSDGAEWSGDAPARIRVIVERPSVYALYEQNIGLLTPILAEHLQDAESRYPMEWIEAAFEEAVANNKRSWRYIERILERWAAEGKDSGKDRGLAGRGLDPEKYTKGKYAFLFRPDR
jgi:DnaD/phage-associated family protein